MHRIHTPLALLLCLPMLGLLTGCQGEAGPIWFAKRYPESTAQFRTEFEVIPNAELVRIDTRPQWELGRHAYRRGAHRVIVLTRVTSWAPPLEQDWTGFNYKYPDGPRPISDREWERAWITIDYGTPVGRRLQLQDLETQFKTGYDRREDDGDAYYILPHKMAGTITIVEEKPDELIVDLNVEIRPKQTKDWFIRERVNIPITLTGRHAKVAQDSDQLIVTGIYRNAGDRPTLPVTASADRAPDSGNGRTLATDGVKPPDKATDTASANANTNTQSGTDNTGTASDNNTGSNTTDASTADANTDDAGKEPVLHEVNGKSILGQWYVNTKDRAFHFQFNEDGSCNWAVVTDDGPVLAVKGAFKVKPGYIIIQAFRMSVGGKDNSAALRTKFSLLRTSWNGDKLQLEGPLRNLNVRLRTYKKEFVDLQASDPPATRAGADKVDPLSVAEPTSTTRQLLR